MAQGSPPHRRRALIVEDEIRIALGLEAETRALDFGVCELAIDPQGASLLAMGDQPDVVLMDVCLQGGREASTSRGGSKRYATCLSSSSLGTRTATPSNAFTGKFLALQCCRSQFLGTAIVSGLQPPPQHLSNTFGVNDTHDLVCSPNFCCASRS
jgi:hypothetical protein